MDFVSWYAISLAATASGLAIFVCSGSLLWCYLRREHGPPRFIDNGEPIIVHVESNPMSA